ncbi:MAG TPA: metallophosphoesterase [Ktedonobacterales bacterium]|nr:metallophosphoesterase [Ktedonobacterales bacterium]
MPSTLAPAVDKSIHIVHAAEQVTLGSSVTPQPTATGDVVLVHTSDLHVEDGSVGRYHGLLGLGAVLQKAQSLSADIVLLAGDTFDNHRVSQTMLQRTREVLASARVPVVLLPGNHDSILPECLFRRAGLDELKHVHVLGVTHSEAIIFVEHDLEIRGQALYGFADMAPLRAPSPRTARWQIVMAHGHYVPPHEWDAQSHRAWRISDAALAATGADYVALGHWDRATPVGDGTVPAYYSGSPDLAGTVNVIRLNPESGVSVMREPLHSTWGSD